MIRTNLRPTGREKPNVATRILLREQSAVIGFGVIFLMGVAIGAAVVSWLDADAAQNLLTILGGFVKERRQQPLAATFLSALAPNLLMMALLAVCGFCAVSAPLILTIPCFKGLGFGLSASAMLVCYGPDAVGYLGVLVLPNMICSTVILLFGCRDALRMSHAFWNTMKPQQRGSIPRPGTFCAHCILYAVLLCAGAVVEAYSFFFFSGIFALA